jgi:hypothetical protein
MNHPDQSQGSEEKERIEKDAEGLSRLRVWPEQLRLTFKSGYIAGATAELSSIRSELSKKDEEMKLRLQERGKTVDTWIKTCAIQNEEIKQLKEALKEYNEATDYSKTYQMWSPTKELDKAYNKARKLLEK